MCHFSGYHFQCKVFYNDYIFFQILEDSTKNLLAQAFFSYFPSKTKVLTVKQLKQTEYITEMLFLRQTRGHFEKSIWKPIL